MQYSEEQLRYLQLMDIEVWTSKDSYPTNNQAQTEQQLQPMPDIEPAIEKQKESDKASAAKLTAVAPEKIIPVTPDALASVTDVSMYNWSQLAASAQQCVQCDLHQTRKNVVFGVGDQQADLLLIGEAPGEQEDELGEPFVGRAGLLLNNMIKAIGLDRKNIYIANVLKCRPPSNRDPREDEMLACQGFLNRQIELIKPKVIAAVGRIAAQQLLDTNQTIGKLRGKVHRIDKFDAPIIVTYHPAYLLRKPSEKAKSWQDLKQIHEVLTPSE